VKRHRQQWRATPVLYKTCASSRLDKASKRSQSSTVSLTLNRNLSSLSARLVLAAIASFTGTVAMPARAQELPSLINVVDYSKLLPLLPDAPADWTADKPEGSTTDVGGFKLTNVHRDYRKGEGDKAPTTAISILDSAANPDYVEATTAAWNFTTTSTEGYSKAVTVDGNPGFETFENEGKHGTLWIMVAKRYFLQIETQGQDPAALQEWAKRVDVKKLATIK
jgi:hypothetical protein